MKSFFPKFKEPKKEGLSTTWLQSFMRRHNLKTLLAHKTEAARIQYSCINLLQPWHENILTPALEDVPPCLIFNMDETMVQFGARVRVVCSQTSKRVLTQSSEINEHITAVCCISATGKKLIPFMIYQLKTSSKSLIERVEQNLMTIGGQSSGWIDRNLFCCWVQWFIEQVQLIRTINKQEDKRAVLILDSHPSRKAPSALKMLKSNNIDVITLVAHTSGVAQPLDVAIFGGLKTILARKYRKLLLKTQKKKKKDSFTKQQKRICMTDAFLHSWDAAATSLNILSGFEATGIYPLDFTKLKNNENVAEGGLTPEEVKSKASKKRVRIDSTLLTGRNMISMLEEKKTLMSKKQRSEKTKKKKKKRSKHHHKKKTKTKTTISN